MKWPWVSRRAWEEQAARLEEVRTELEDRLDEARATIKRQVHQEVYGAVVAERDRLLEEVAELREHVIRMTRVGHGRPEEPRPPRTRVTLPAELKSFIKDFDDKRVRTQLLRESRQAIAAGMDPRHILQDMKEKMELLGD